MDQWWDSPPLQMGISWVPVCLPAVVEIIDGLLACLINQTASFMLLFVKSCSLVCLSCWVSCVWICFSAVLIFLIKGYSPYRAVAVLLRQKKLSPHVLVHHRMMSTMIQTTPGKRTYLHIFMAWWVWNVLCGWGFVLCMCTGQRCSLSYLSKKL